MAVQVLMKELIDEASVILWDMSKPIVMPPHWNDVVWTSRMQPLAESEDAMEKGRNWLSESTLS